VLATLLPALFLILLMLLLLLLLPLFLILFSPSSCAGLKLRCAVILRFVCKDAAGCDFCIAAGRPPPSPPSAMHALHPPSRCAVIITIAGSAASSRHRRSKSFAPLHVTTSTGIVTPLVKCLAVSSGSLLTLTSVQRQQPMM
jgi:hypothetical protein